MRSLCAVVALCLTVLPSAALAQVEYRVIATNKTSTAEKEMNEAADAGFRFGGVMGGDTMFGGSEVVTVMHREPGSAPGRFGYKLLATTRTSTMQKEMQEAGDAGFDYRGQTVFKTLFGGKETVVVLERDRDEKDRPSFDYRLVATSKTSTLQKELGEAGAAGYQFVGLTVADTALGGAELVAILRKARP
jgi:hypothetical protein